MREDKEHGFALMEVLASLTIVGMMALLLMQGITTGRRVWESQDARLDRMNDILTAQVNVRGRLEQIYPMARFDSSRPYVDLDGSASQMTAPIIPPGQGALAVVQRMRLSLRGGDLVIDQAPDFGQDPLSHARSEVLLKRVRSVEFAYFRKAKGGLPGGWTSRWVQEPLPPAAIRLKVYFADSDQRRWPDLIIRPKATVDDGCILDHAGGSCRGRS